MYRLMNQFAVFLLVLTSLPVSVSVGQHGGSRAGVENYSDYTENLSMLSREAAEGFITIDGRAEIRLRPTEIRIVLAVTSEGQTAQECQQTIDETIRKLKAAWTGMGIPDEKIVEDFIAVLPVYEWIVEKRGTRDADVEKKSGFRMQTNIHLAVVNDASVKKALTLAFEQGVTDIIAFDYWSKELDEMKTTAREQAVKAARNKSDILLALFEDRPPLINVQEQTTIRYPESLYDSFVNTFDEELTPGRRDDQPSIRAYRPRNTYYRGLRTDSDIQGRELPTSPEIYLVSTVRLYFESPAAIRSSKGKGEEED